MVAKKRTKQKKIQNLNSLLRVFYTLSNFYAYKRKLKKLHKTFLLEIRKSENLEEDFNSTDLRQNQNQVSLPHIGRLINAGMRVCYLKFFQILAGSIQKIVMQKKNHMGDL